MTRNDLIANAALMLALDIDTYQNWEEVNYKTLGKIIYERDAKRIVTRQLLKGELVEFNSLNALMDYIRNNYPEYFVNGFIINVDYLPNCFKVSKNYYCDLLDFY